MAAPEPALGSLLAAIEAVRRRLVATTVLGHVNTSLTWGLSALLLAAAAFPLRIVVGALVVLMVAAVVASVSLGWRSRPSEYDSACRLDAAAGLNDRLPTAWHYRGAENPGDMIVRQRRDALQRMTAVDPRALFALRLPRAFGRTLALALALVVLIGYRTSHTSPLAAVAERVAPNGIVRAIAALRHPEVAPREQARASRAGGEATDEPDVDLETMNVRSSPEGARSRSKAGSRGTNGDPDAEASDSVEDPEDGPQDAQSGPDQMPRPGSGLQKNEAGPSSQGQAGAPNQDKAPSESAAPPDGAASTPSLAQRMTQALKDLISKAMGEQPKDKNAARQGPSGDQPAPDPNAKKMPAPPGGQQAGGPSPAPGEKDSKSGAAGEARTGGDAGEGNAPNGEGNEPVAGAAGQNPSIETHPKQDVVPLVLTNVKGQATLMTSSQRGQAMVPLRDVAPRSTASTKGAEQGDVPLRYRAYVQRYFHHPDEVRR
jgi:hypothetical protein